VGRGGALGVDDFQPEGRGFDSCSSRHVGTLGKSFTYISDVHTEGNQAQVDTCGWGGQSAPCEHPNK